MNFLVVNRCLLTTHLVSFEVGSSAGGETFLAAEALKIRTHTQGIAFHTFLLAPNTDDLDILYVLHCRANMKRRGQQ